MSQRDEGVRQALPRGLIVSCQAGPESPLHGPAFMAAMALAAQHAGAVGVRVNGPADIEAVHKVVNLPIIGIFKRPDLEPEAYITPSMTEVEAVLAAGADIVAVDATERARSYGPPARELLANAREKFPNLWLMADVSTFAEGLAAADAGADLVATTLSGYTTYSRQSPGPDIELVEAMAHRLPCPVIAEGRFDTPERATRALESGAYAVVVGTAITNPTAIAQGFSNAMRSHLERPNGNELGSRHRTRTDI